MQFKTYMSLSDALEASGRYEFRAKKKTVHVEDSIGKYAYLDIVSPEDFPKHPKSAVDGFAVISSETISSTRTNPSSFRLVGESSPENDFTGVVGRGEAVKVYTGGRMPEGTDSVVMMEDSEVIGGEVKVYVPLRKFQNVSRKGEDIEKGFTLVKRGEMITPPHLAAFLEVGLEKVDIVDFRIGVLSTGNELVKGKVKNSTQPFLVEYFRWNGFDAVGLGIVGDDEGEIEKKIKETEVDAFVITGGTGPSEKDVLSYFLEQNATKIFHGLKIRPARTSGLYIYYNRPVFISSGLPVAALISAENVILPIISRWSGIMMKEKIYVEGILTRTIVNNLGFRSFVRVSIESKGEEVLITPTRVTGSGVIYSIISADGIVEIDENSEGYLEGSKVKASLLRW